MNIFVKIENLIKIDNLVKIGTLTFGITLIPAASLFLYLSQGPELHLNDISLAELESNSYKADITIENSGGRNAINSNWILYTFFYENGEFSGCKMDATLFTAVEPSTLRTLHTPEMMWKGNEPAYLAFSVNYEDSGLPFRELRNFLTKDSQLDVVSFVTFKEHKFFLEGDTKKLIQIQALLDRVKVCDSTTP